MQWFGGDSIAVALFWQVQPAIFLVFGYIGRTYIDNLTAIESPPNNSVTTSGERGTSRPNFYLSEKKFTRFVCEIIYFCRIKKYKDMDKITIEMSQHEYKKFLAYKEADKIVKCIRRGLNEVKEAREGKRELKSAYELAYEL